MTNRRPPPPQGFDQDAETFVRRPAVESTALLERPLFSDAFDNLPSRDDDDDDDAPTEQTDAERRVLLPADAATGRYQLNDLDDLVDDLPDAHISEFDVSDMDGDVVDIAATTIMQLPPSMIGHHPPEPVEQIAVRKWSAGPQAMLPTPDPANITLDGDDDDDDDELPPLTPPPARRAALAPTMPFLSVSAVKAGAFLVDAPVALAEPPRTHAPVPTSVVTDISTGEPGLRDTLDDALAALLAAQACADAGGVPRGLNTHLEKAVELLSRAIDLAEGD
jgi:hypothetical protein